MSGTLLTSGKVANLASALFQFYSDHSLKKGIRRWRNFRGRFTFENRSSCRSKLLVIAAGYKPRLFPLTLRRVERFTPPGWDVCICCAGLDSFELQEICQRNKWSYLTTQKNQISLAQNLAIAEHSTAEMIVKMDEDIFLAENTLAELVTALETCEHSGSFHPGILAPLLNVNGFTSRILLERLGRLSKFEAQFGPCRQACVETPVWQDPEAARFLWESILPFDETASQLGADVLQFSACPHRFSIGCFVMRREFWEAMQGLTVAPEGALGIDEIDLCAYANATSRPVMVAHHLLVGHAGFGHQMALMEPWLVEKQV